jgi:putative transposase
VPLCPAMTRSGMTTSTPVGYCSAMSGRKRLRLDLEHYSVPGLVWHVSAPTLERRPVFQDAEFAGAVIQSLQFQCDRTDTDLLVYCLMPDHLHAVAAIGDTDLITVLHGFKSYTTTLWRKRSGHSRLWQESFHDHGVRRSERMDELVKYIVENPQKAGLVSDWLDYPWIGGKLFAEGKLGDQSS